MRYSFTCYGHENITAKHKTTLEFTKDTGIGLEGDCIVGVRADFQLNKIKQFIKNMSNNKITIIIKPTLNNNKNKINKKITEKINAEINPGFNSDKEMVIRKTDFVSERTFAIMADKAACELDKDLIRNIANNKQKISVLFYY